MIKSSQIPKCVNRFLATVRRDWHCSLRRLSSSKARVLSRTPKVTLRKLINQ